MSPISSIRRDRTTDRLYRFTRSKISSSGLNTSKRSRTWQWRLVQYPNPWDFGMGRASMNLDKFTPKMASTLTTRTRVCGVRASTLLWMLITAALATAFKYPASRTSMKSSVPTWSSGERSRLHPTTVCWSRQRLQARMIAMTRWKATLMVAMSLLSIRTLRLTQDSLWGTKYD